MDLSPILNPLNDAQRAAVTAPLGPVLVLAGAGSGKTRVLTHRIIWVIQAENASPHSILAVTFTNKAAAEMRGRVEQLLSMPSGGLWIGTFHGTCARLLDETPDLFSMEPECAGRFHADYLGFDFFRFYAHMADSGPDPIEP